MENKKRTWRWSAISKERWQQLLQRILRPNGKASVRAHHRLVLGGGWVVAAALGWLAIAPLVRAAAVSGPLALTWPDDWLLKAALTGLAVVASARSGKVDVPGALMGGLLTGLLFLGTGWLGPGLLLLFFVLGTGVSQYRLTEKVAAGLAESRGNRRSVANVLANGAAAGLFATLAWALPAGRVWWEWAVATALVVATADTLSSELGNVWGRRYVHVLSGRPDQRGRDGAISLEGTLAGTLGGGLVAGVFALWTGQPWAWPVLTALGLLGTWLDSVLGATLQRRAWLDNHAVNAQSTFWIATLGAWLGYALAP